MTNQSPKARRSLDLGYWLLVAVALLPFYLTSEERARRCHQSAMLELFLERWTK